jgi:hypothetical protein
MLICFVKHCYIFRYLYIILRVASRYFCLLRIYNSDVCTVNIVPFYYICSTNVIYIDSIFLKTLLHVSVFIHHPHEDRF